LKLSNYVLKGKRRGLILRRAASTSRDEVREALNIFLEKPTALALATLLRNMFNSGVWVSKSTLELLFSLLKLIEEADFDPSDEKTKSILTLVAAGSPVDGCNDAQVFHRILGERHFCHKNPGFKPVLKIPKIDTHLVLISGVFNEIFSTAAFERGAEHLCELTGINFSTVNVNGRKSSRHNAQLIHEQLQELAREGKSQKMWLLGFSKGGVDTLHFLRSYAKH